MSRILLLTPQLPFPPHQGTSLRNWHILRGLSERHTVTLLSYTEGEPDYISPQLTSCCERVETVATPDRTTSQRLSQLVRSPRPDMAYRLASEAFATALRRVLQTSEFDIVQVEGLEMAHAIPVIRENSRARIVLDCHNAETELQRRAFATDTRQLRRWPAAAYSRVQIDRLADYERWAVESSDAAVAVSDEDASVLRALIPDYARPLAVVPNCIDVEEYSLSPATILPEQQFDLVFSGKMDYRPNVDAVLWFADQVWPLLQLVRPGLTWGIVGQKPHGQLDRLRPVAGITITGRVERVQPYLAAASVVIMPLRIGSGTRLKLIEAMAGAKAVVSTPLGAEGFPVRDGEHLLLAQTPHELAAAVLRLLDDEALRHAIGRAARGFAEGYDWRVVVPKLDEVYAAVLANGELPPAPG